ncbi:MAG: CdaR family protein [Kyrpidia sp.]|nr:CdaR family protein [Kyrpidia sp.]
MKKGGRLGRLARMWNRENAVPKLIAFVLAVLLWFVAGAGTTDTPTSILSPTARVMHGVTVQVLFDEGAVIPVGGPPQVDLTVRGTRLDLMSPVLGRIRAVADARGLGQGVYELPVQLEDVPPGITYDPVYVTVRLDRAAQRQIRVSVQTAGVPKPGFAVGTITSSPAQVTVSGREADVARVDAALARVSVDGADQAVRSRMSVVPVDRDGQPIAGLRVDPEAVDVSVAVDPRGKTVPVAVEIRGTPAGDLAVDSWTADPARVTVAGPPEVLDKIDRMTGVVDVSGLNGDHTFTVRLTAPDGVRAVDPDTVQVTVHLAPGKTSTMSQVPVKVVGLPPGAGAAVKPSTVNVTLRGAASHITAMKSSDVAATVDVTGKEPGTYSLPVTVQVPSWATVADPPTVEVTITAAPAGAEGDAAATGG